MDARTVRRTLGSLAIMTAILLVCAIAVPAGAQSSIYVVTWFVAFNTTLPPFDNVMMRQAVAHAVDRNQLAASDKNDPSRGLEPPGCLAHNPAAQPYPFDPQKAKDLIVQSKVNLDELGDLGLWYISRLERRDTAKKELEVLAANLASAGLQIRLREFGNYDALKRIATMQVVKMQYWGVGSYTRACSQETILEDLVHSKGDLNYFGYANPETDALIARARTTGDRSEKIRLFQEVEQKILSDAILVPVWWWRVR